MKARQWSIASCLIGSLGCAAPSTVTSQVTQPIQGGMDDTTDTAVVGIAVLTPQGIATCSGSLLTPNIVLTARHCVSTLSNMAFVCQTYTDPQSHVTYQTTTASAPFAASNFYVTSDATIDRTSTTTRVSQVLIPPDSTGVALCGKDIALLQLSQPMVGARLIEPRLDQAPLINEMFTAIGYGATDGNGTAAGTRRIRSGLTIELVGMFAQSGIERTADQEFIADTGTCEGDSGGPALDGIGAVLGSVSRGDAYSCDSPVYTRVDGYAQFIRDSVRAAATTASIALPTWIDPPVAGSANFGDDCRSDAQCVDGLSCYIIGNRRRCTDTGCNCPVGWVCGDTSGLQACVPDGSAPAIVDSGTATTADGGTASDASTPPVMNHGCDTGPRVPSRNGLLAALLGLSAMLVVNRRRRQLPSAVRR